MHSATLKLEDFVGSLETMFFGNYQFPWWVRVREYKANSWEVKRQTFCGPREKIMASGVMVVKSEVLLKQTVKYSQMHSNGAYEEKEKLKVGW